MNTDLQNFFNGGFDARKYAVQTPVSSPEYALLDELNNNGLLVHRLNVNDDYNRVATTDRPNKLNGWYRCKYSGDHLFASYGNWALGSSHTWSSADSKSMSPAERTMHEENMKQMRNQAAEEKQRRYDEAAAKAQRIWDSSQPADPQHPYLKRKRIQPHGIKQSGKSLVVPLHYRGKLSSLQFISENGDKTFLSGGRIKGAYFVIGESSVAGVAVADPIFAAEGFSTGATVHEATSKPVLIFFNANNLNPGLREFRQTGNNQYVIITADNDHHTAGNPGKTKALEAAEQDVNASIIWPEGITGTDYNDVCIELGIDAVTRALKVTPEFVWPEPQPLTTPIDELPYPIDAFPDGIRNAILEVQKFVQSPLPLAASSALASLSLAAQALADVRRVEGLVGPISINQLVIASSGERKTTGDRYFAEAIRAYEKKQEELAKPILDDYAANLEAWTMRQSGVKQKIHTLAKSEKSSRIQEEALRNLQAEKPEPPRVPKLLLGDATPEALKWALAKVWPSGGVISSEGGLIFGAHGMGKDSIMRNLATQNLLWDGMEVTTDRRTSESFTVRGARLTTSIQVQPEVIKTFTEKSEGLARGTGFFARYLFSSPNSTQGYRPFVEAPAKWPALEQFNSRISTLLNIPLPMDDDGILQPNILPLSPDAKRLWIEFHDEIECQLIDGGDYHDVRDVASKVADNAARIAALLHIFDNGPEGAISAQHFEGAASIAKWHLHEARRFFGQLSIPHDQLHAIQLDSWLISYCGQHRVDQISRRDLQRLVTPTQLRKGMVLDQTLDELEARNRIRIVTAGKAKNILINSELLKRI